MCVHDDHEDESVVPVPGNGDPCELGTWILQTLENDKVYSVDVGRDKAVVWFLKD